MKSPAITAKPTGSLPRRAFDLYDTIADHLDFDSAQVAWSGCLDATHVVPSGSCVPSSWKVGATFVATTTHQLR